LDTMWAEDMTMILSVLMVHVIMLISFIYLDWKVNGIENVQLVGHGSSDSWSIVQKGDFSGSFILITRESNEDLCAV
jgi:hypothetical protein